METVTTKGNGSDIDDAQEFVKGELRKGGCTSDDILRLLVYSPLENKSFVPNGALEELITFDTITSTLAAVGLPAAELLLLARAIVERGRRVFAILVFINQVRDIKTLFKEGFTDEMLPVAYQAEGDSWQVRSYTPNSDNLDQGKVWVFFQDWKKSTIFSFCERQWMFLSPVFSKDQFKYFLHRDAILPFVSAKGQTKQSYFSMVFHVKVHAAHQRFGPTIGRPLDCAIKELAASDSENTFEKESNALACMRKIDHKHLIKCIAAVQKEQRYFFVFPWANGGNLREYWASNHFASSSIKTISWAISQMLGLADALKELHNCNTRHGDIKPENILRFSDDAGPGHGRLVIADVGLAKVHTNTTRSRHFPTRTVTGTARYEAPEAFLPDQSRSRVYDVWGLGCIYLEFIVWMLYGWDSLQRFNSSFESYANAMKNGPNIPQLDPLAQECMGIMLRDPRCGRRTALGEILDFTKRRLLVPVQDEKSAPLRASAKELHDHLNIISQQCFGDPAYMFNLGIWETRRRSSLSSYRPSETLLLPPSSRGLELSLQIKRDKKIPSLPQLESMTGRASILGEILTEEPAALKIDPHATARPAEDSSISPDNLTTPVANADRDQGRISNDFKKYPPGCDIGAEVNDKSGRSTLYGLSSNDSSCSVGSSYNYGSSSSISEDLIEGTSQNRVVDSLVERKKEYIADKTLAWFTRTLDSGLTLAAYQQGETSTSGKAALGDGKLVGDNKGGSSAQKKRKGVEDNNNENDPDDDDDEEDDDRKGKGKKKPRTSVNHAQKFACPFFKYDPELYGENMTCRGHSWSTVHRIKEHLFRTHTQPEGRCHRCLEVFKNVSSLQKHQREPVPCEIVGNNGCEVYIDAETAQKLRRKSAKGLLPKKSEPVKWKEMFNLLFPHVEHTPSPYFDDTQDKRSELEVIQDFSSFAARELWAEMNAVLTESGIEDTLRARLIERFQSSQPMIQEKYLRKQRHSRPTAAEKEAESPAASNEASNLEESSHHGGPHDESGKEDDTRNEGGGDIIDTPMNASFRNSNRHANEQFGDELIPDIFANIVPNLFPEMNTFPPSNNMLNYTAPAALQNTGLYETYGTNRDNNGHQNLSDNSINPMSHLNPRSFAQNTYRSFGTSPNIAPFNPAWRNPGQQDPGTGPPDPQLTPMPLTPTVGHTTGAATPSYAHWQQRSPLSITSQLQSTHFDQPLGVNETSNMPRTMHYNSFQEPNFGYSQPSQEQNIDPLFFDSGYLTMGRQTAGDAKETSSWDPPTEGCEE
ncbi:hypothetical protein GGS24DRAFT_484809 [Hypoxylon argillaceum]|nr:hypothetical protein GGS24DRAFT_484809 [Hypoxylon argillaceum]